MSKLKSTAGLAGLLAALIAIVQWAISQWDAFAALLLSLGIAPEVLELVKTVLTLILTLAGAYGVYQVRARGVWSK